MAQKKAAPRAKNVHSRRNRGSREDVEHNRVVIEKFERALRILHDGDLASARRLFESIVAEFPEETDLADRARVYLAVCNRRLRPAAPNPPQGFEEVVAQGVFRHNQGDYQGAVEFLARAVEMDPKNDHAHYCLAASYARLGDGRGALRHLKRAISGDSYNRVLAKTDRDFDSLRNDSAIAQLLAESAPGATTT